MKARIAATLAGIALLSGCAGPGSPATTAPSAPATTAWAPVDFPKPDLGPVPSPSPETEVERQVRWASEQDAAWERVLQEHPNAQRPPVPFTEWAGEDRMNDVIGCLEDADVPIIPAHTVDGDVAGYEWDTAALSGPDAERSAVQIFVCEGSFPQIGDVPTPDQLGYAYDWLTRYTVPCYAANGHALVNDEIPPKEEWVAVWPGYSWWPQFDGIDAMGLEERSAALETACPMPE